MKHTRGSETAGTEEDEDVAAVDDPISEERMGFATLYQGPIHNQAAHFGALQILEEYCRMGSDAFADFQVPLIVVKPTLAGTKGTNLPKLIDRETGKERNI
jgi:hypothetical protein